MLRRTATRFCHTSAPHTGRYRWPNHHAPCRRSCIPLRLNHSQPDEIRQFHPAPANSPVRLNRQLRCSYAHATDATPLRYEQNRYRYEERRTPLSGTATLPAQNSRSTPRRNPPTLSRPTIPRHPTLMLHMCQLWPSYDHATNATLFRYESPFFRYEKCSMSIASPYLDRRHHPPRNSSPRHDEIRQPRPVPPNPLRGTTWSNTSQLRQWNEWNAFQIQITRPQLRTEFHSLSGAGPLPAPNIPGPPHDEIHQLPIRQLSNGHGSKLSKG